MKRTFGNALLIMAVIGALAGAYFLGRAQRGSPDRSSAAVPAPHAAPAAAGELPASHPALAQQPAAGHGEGATGPRFAHFRVGQRNVKSLLADGPITWVGTSGGVIRYDTRSDDYRVLDVRSGLLANGVFHLSKLQGRLAVGTYGGGLALRKADDSGWELFNVPEGLADAFVYDVLVAHNGDVWIATWSGANRVRGGALRDPARWDTFTVKSTGGGLPNDWVYALAQGPDGAIWLATEGGLARYQDGLWRHWQHQDGLGAPYEMVRDHTPFTSDPARYSKHHARQKTEQGLEQVEVAYNPNYIVSLAVDRQGIVWCGTWGGGLARFDGEHWTNYTVADGLPGNHVFMLHEDPRGRLWIGTNAGLARREGERFKVFTTRDGLFSDTVFSMAVAADGSLWVGSYGGVAHIAELP